MVKAKKPQHKKVATMAARAALVRAFSLFLLQKGHFDKKNSRGIENQMGN
jgi:hypothetical protein